MKRSRTSAALALVFVAIAFLTLTGSHRESMMEIPAQFPDGLTSEGATVATSATGITTGEDDQFSSCPQKATPVNGDRVLIEDSAASYAKKWAALSDLPTGGGGEANTASNVGTAGVGVFKQKVGIDLRFKKVNAAAGGKVTITDDVGNDEVDVQVVDGTTTQKGAVELATDGESSANVVVQGNDSRLSDSRTPTGSAGGDLGGTYPNPTVDDGADSTAIHDNVASEISAVTLKGTPVSADLILIEDSAAANAKKRITIGSLPSSTIFGSGYYDGKNTAEASYTGTTNWQNRVTFTTGSVAAGEYIVSWYCELACDVVNEQVSMRVQVDDTTTFCGPVFTPDTSYGNGGWHPCGGSAHITLTAATHTVDLDYRIVSDAGDTVYIRYAYLHIWRVE